MIFQENHEFPGPPCFFISRKSYIQSFSSANAAPSGAAAARPWSVNCCAESVHTAALLFGSGNGRNGRNGLPQVSHG